MLCEIQVFFVKIINIADYWCNVSVLKEVSKVFKCPGSTLLCKPQKLSNFALIMCSSVNIRIYNELFLIILI